jgi:hypothetical protein
MYHRKRPAIVWHTSRIVAGRIAAQIILKKVTFTMFASETHSRNTVRQDQELWMTDTGKKTSRNDAYTVKPR